jgi:hypothetical protein
MGSKLDSGVQAPIHIAFPIESHRRGGCERAKAAPSLPAPRREDAQKVIAGSAPRHLPIWAYSLSEKWRRADRRA